MSDIIDVRNGLPNVRPSRGIPKPFQRKRIEVGQKGEKREWRWVSPWELGPEDLVQDIGLLYTVIEDGDQYLIRGGENNERRVMSGEQVWAFTMPAKPVERGESEVGSMEVRFDAQA